MIGTCAAALLMATLTAAPPPPTAHATDAASDRAQAERLLAPRQTSAVQQDKAGLKSHASKIKKAKSDVSQVYKKVAPATVIVRSRDGFGTGVVIDPSGFILTNHHVIADGEWEGLRLKVTVELGALSEQGVMEKTGKAYTAYVHKSDKLLDLAVIKLVDPPKDLAVVAISKKDPVPGEAVAAVGNGGIGLLWAIKSGEIASIGKLATHLATIAAAECRGPSCAATNARLDEAKSLFERTVPGLVIQSTCTLSPGDSGGPLVNQAGDLVGLNAFLRTNGHTPVTANFHVHVAEIRGFLTAVPATPQPVIPDPWAEAAGGLSMLVDTDLDGTVDTLMIDMGRVIFYDLDQDSFAKGAPVPALADEVVRKRSFDAEAAMLRTEGRLLVWFDTDNDKSWDRLVVSSMEGAPVLYSLTKTGEATEMKYEGNPYLAAATFADPAMLARLKQVAGEQLGLPEEEGEMKVPQLFVSRFAMPLDSDKNGHIDTLVAASPGSQVFLFDGEEKRFGKLTPVEAMRAYSARSVTADMAIVAHKNKAWAFYDRTGTGKFDLLLYTSDMHTGAVSDAYHLVDGKLGDPAPEHVGLRLVRPKLFASPVAAKRLATAAHVHCQPFLVADNESLGALPSVLLDGEAEADFAEVELPGFETAAVSLEGDDTMSLLLDVDRDSFKGMRTPPADVNAFVAKGQFKAEIAFVARADARWAFYDTDHDGHFDLALFVPKGANEVKQAFRIDKKGKLTADPKAVAGRLMRWSVLPKPMQANAKQLLAELFLAEQIEE